MTKQNEHKNIPELRFPEFKDDRVFYLRGEELFESISNKNHNSNLPVLAITQEQGAIPREIINYHVSVTEKSLESYKVVEIGDFIISLRSFQGGIEYSNFKGLCSPAYIVLQKKTDLIPDYYRYYFKSFTFIRDLNKNLEGIRDGKMITYKQFSEILIPKPRQDEQQKIANCLSYLDEVIIAHSDKLAILKDHKKGLMQILFPKEGEKVPKYRFLEFKDDGEWKEKKLGELVNIKSGTSPTNYNLITKGEYPFLKVEDLNNSVKYQKKSREYSNDKNNIVPQMSVIFPKRGAAILLNKLRINLQEVIMDSNLMAISPSDKLLSEFLFYKVLKDGLYKIADTSTIPQINNKHIEPYVISIPKNLKEQNKIAETLSSLDDLIIAQTEKIEQLKIHKKGLMQKLFPAINE